MAGVTVLGYGGGIEGLIGAFMVSQMVYLIILRYLHAGLRFFALLNPNALQPLLKQSWPYLLVALLTLIYIRVDLVIITHWLGAASAGYYSAAYRFLDAAGLFPGALAATQTPIFARLGQDKRLLRERYKTLFMGCAALGAGMAAFLFFFADSLILFLYGPSFIPATEVLQILSLAAFFTFIHSVNVAFVFSLDKGKAVAGLSLATAGLNVGLNILWVPAFGVIGAAWATVIGDLVSFLLFYRMAKIHLSDKGPF